MSIKELAEFTRISKYSRYLPDKQRRESWKEQVDRMMDMHKTQLEDLGVFDNVKEEWEFAKSMLMKKRVLGSQRALQFGGEAVLRHNARLYNCCFSYIDRIRVFKDIMYLALCGVGIGYSVQKHHIDKLPNLNSNNKKNITYVIADSIEGWADAIGALVESYFSCDSIYSDCNLIFDYTSIRPSGAIIKSSGSKAPGPDGLRRTIDNIKNIFNKAIVDNNERLSSLQVHDIICHIADSVVSGGIRRAALISLFSKDDEEMKNCKTGNWFIENPQRGRSNNSVMLMRDDTTKEEFDDIISSVKEYGEPGFIFSDSKEIGYNPSLRKGTKVLTNNGILPIESLQENNFKVKNLHGNWENATCRLSGRNKPLYKLTLSNNTIYYATKEHKWPTIKNGKIVKKNTCDLEVNDNLPLLSQSDLSYGDKGNYNDGFTCGWLYGDGGITDIKDNDVRHYGLIVSGEDEENGVIDILTEVLTNNSSNPVNWSLREKNKEINLQSKSLTKYFRSFSVDKKEKGLPVNIWTECSEEFRKGFIDGIFSSDGCVSNYSDNKGSENETCKSRISLVSSSQNLVEDIKELLGFYGIESIITTTVYTGDRTIPNGETYCGTYESYSLKINRASSKKHFRDTFKLTHKKKDDKLTDITKDIEINPLMRKIGVTSVEKTDLKEDVWDLTVFDSTHCFQLSHCITGNCAEIGLYPVDVETGKSGVEFCNLSEINAKKCKTPEDFMESAKAAAILGTFQASYCKFPYLGETTEKIAAREALLGVSITGMQDNPEIVLDPEYQRAAAKVVKNTNKEIAAKIGINQAARTTTVKPSGTSSIILSTGASGIHPNHAKRYIRRVQCNNQEEPLQFFKTYNPRAVETSVWDSNGVTEVISFLCEVPSHARTKNDVGALKLLEDVKSTWINWVDQGKNEELCTIPELSHNVSNTINVLEDNWSAVSDYIFSNRKYFAGISLLPQEGDKIYPQAPFQTVYTPKELIDMYGDASVFASGLIVHAQNSFDGNLYAACDSYLGIGEKLEIPDIQNSEIPESIDKLTKILEKQMWVKRADKFANNYFDGDKRKMTFCLKDVDAWKTWCDLGREYKEVPWEKFSEDKDNTKISEDVACSGGSCTLTYI